MSVDPAGGCQHGSFAAAPNGSDSSPQCLTDRELRCCVGTFAEGAAQCLGRGVQHVEGHVGVCAGSAAIDQAGLRRQVGFIMQRGDSEVGDLLGRDCGRAN
jgi:hypothetical protein